MKGLTSLQQSLQQYVAGEELEGVSCEACGTKGLHTKGFALLELPDILSLQLKRFDLNYMTMQRVKLNDKIEIPLILDMRPFLRARDQEELADFESTEPVRYELLSILMHVGSALSGHYFAYIRDVSSGRWLNFNDAHVAGLDMHRLNQILGSEPGGELESAAAEQAKEKNQKPEANAEPLQSANSNAYMLVYRRMREGSQTTVDDLSIPKEIAEEIAEENAKFDALKAEWEEERKWLNMTAYYLGPAKPIRIHQDRSVADLTDMVISAFASDLGAIPAERIRLRWYDALKSVSLEPLDDASMVLSSITGDMVRRPVKVEIREEGDKFEEYLANGLPISILRLLDDGETFAAPMSLSIDVSETVGGIREAIAKKIGAQIERTALVWFPGDTPQQLDDDSRPIGDLNISACDTLHVENRHVDEPSRLSQYFEGLVNLITIHYTDPRTVTATADASSAIPGDIVSVVNQLSADEIALNGEKRTVQVDQRAPLRDLKNRIAEEINLAPIKFKLRRTAGGIELKDLTQPIIMHGFEEGDTIYIKVGKPMVPGEWQFNCKFAPTLDGECTPLGPVVLNQDLSVADTKKALYAAFSESHGLPTPDFMRLRIGASTGVVGKVKLGVVMVDDDTIGACFGAKLIDGKIIAVQPTSGPEKFTSDHMLLRARHWQPTAKVLGELQEIGVLRTATALGLKEQLAAAAAKHTVAAPAPEDIWIVKPYAYLLKEVANLPLLKWEPQPEHGTIISTAPLRFRDGDLFVYKDSREQEDITPEIASQIAAQKLQTTIVHEEQGFAIYTPAQQAERETKKREAEEASKKEQVERISAIQASISRAGRSDADE